LKGIEFEIILVTAELVHNTLPRGEGHREAKFKVESWKPLNQKGKKRGPKTLTREGVRCPKKKSQVGS